MSNFYGGKQGFSFFIAKLYNLKISVNNTFIEKEVEYNTIEEFLSTKFNEDDDVHYNDYILISVGLKDANFNALSKYHGNLYRKDITEFKLVGNLAGPPGGASQVIPLNWDAFDQKYEEDKKNYDGKISPTEIGETEILANIVDGKTNNKISFKYYTIENSNGTTVLKLAIQIPAPYIDFTDFYEPDKTGAAPEMKLKEREEENPFYYKYQYPLVTKYYRPRIDKDELYGDLYTYQKSSDESQYSYKNSGETILLGTIKQESGILIGKNIAYYILESEAAAQTDSDLTLYFENKEKRDSLITTPQDNYILLTNKNLICKKLNDDFPCGLGYKYAKIEDTQEEDKTKREQSAIELIGKIITYGDSTGPVESSKVTTWFFAYDFSRENNDISNEIVPNWYYLNLYSIETKIVFAEDNPSGEGDIEPKTSQEIKAGDLWVGLVDPPEENLI